MKKINLIGMFALTFALVFGAVACSNSAPSSAPDIADVELKDLELKGTWKVTEYESTLELNDEEVFEKLYGVKYADVKDTVNPKDERKVSDFPEMKFETEEAAQTFFKARQEARKATLKNEAEAEKAYVERQKALCEATDVTYVDSTWGGLGDETLTDSEWVTEGSGTSSLTFKKGDDEYTIEWTGTSRTVWTKQ